MNSPSIFVTMCEDTIEWFVIETLDGVDIPVPCDRNNEDAASIMRVTAITLAAHGCVSGCDDTKTKRRKHRRRMIREKEEGGRMRRRGKGE